MRLKLFISMCLTCVSARPLSSWWTDTGGVATCALCARALRAAGKGTRAQIYALIIHSPALHASSKTHLTADSYSVACLVLRWSHALLAPVRATFHTHFIHFRRAVFGLGTLFSSGFPTTATVATDERTPGARQVLSEQILNPISGSGLKMPFQTEPIDDLTWFRVLLDVTMVTMKFFFHSSSLWWFSVDSNYSVQIHYCESRQIVNYLIKDFLYPSIKKLKHEELENNWYLSNFTVRTFSCD